MKTEEIVVQFLNNPNPKRFDMLLSDSRALSIAYKIDTQKVLSCITTLEDYERICFTWKDHKEELEALTFQKIAELLENFENGNKFIPRVKTIIHEKTYSS